MSSPWLLSGVPSGPAPREECEFLVVLSLRNESLNCDDVVRGGVPVCGGVVCLVKV